MGKSKIVKIVFFDEGPVTDYVQIAKGGELQETSELLKEQENNVKGELEATGKFKFGKLLKIFSGAEANLEASVNLGSSLNTNKLVKNIVKNTILTDFINILQNEDNQNVIRKFEGYSISVEKDSMAYFAMVSPYLSMLKNEVIEGDEVEISIEKFDNAIKAGKGYYELVATKDKESVILRFNINSFKNNYRIADLLKMDLSIYAIKVGSARKTDLNFNNELNLDVKTKKNNPSYTDEKQKEEIKNNEKLEVYDVLLAGVEINDK